MPRSTNPVNKVDVAQQQRDQRNIKMFLDHVNWQMAMMSPGQKQQLDEAANALRSRYRNYYG